MQTKVSENLNAKNSPQYFTDSADVAVSERVQALLKTQPRVLVAIDGNSCAGKTTAAAALGTRLQANVFHMDDYFLQPHMRTQERLSQPGGNVDAERFLSDVLTPAANGKAAHVIKYDCHLDRLMDPVELAPRAVAIIEGAYSMHPLLAPYYDVRLFYRVDPALQIERIRVRNGEEMLKMFIERWIPLENNYFNSLDIEAGCDFVVTSTQR
jgi:uridine kinase